jgi:hypothetical protein
LGGRDVVPVEHIQPVFVVRTLESVLAEADVLVACD